MKRIITKICELLNEYTNEAFSSTLISLKDNYEKYKASDNAFEFQSKLLSNMQCAYLNNQHDSVETQDIGPLTNIWSKFVRCLLDSDIDYDEEKSETAIKNGNIPDCYAGLSRGKSSITHHVIMKIYKTIDAISITTNFDNLLNRTFENNNDGNFSFVPILTDSSFNNFNLNNPVEGTSDL